MGKKKKQKFLVITFRDSKLIYYLFRNKVSTVEKIYKEIFTGLHISVVRRRLILLYRFGYVQRSPLVDDEDTLKYKMLYSATKKGLKACEEHIGYEFEQRSVKSGAPKHDLNLLEIQKQFLRSDSVLKWYTENELCCHPLCLSDEKLKYFSEYRIDAAVQVMSANKKRQEFFGIEYERSQKSRDRYMSKVIGPYFNNNIFGMFYICDTEAIMKQIKSCIKEHGDSDNPRHFYYILKDEVLSAKKSFIFRNDSNQTIEIRLNKSDS